MNREQLMEEVRSLLQKTIMKEDADIKPDDKLSSLGLDSIVMVEFVTLTEEKYGISISDNEIENIRTVNDAVDLILKKIQE